MRLPVQNPDKAQRSLPFQVLSIVQFLGHPFGMVIEGRSGTAGDQYRYGFSGMEKDNELYSDGNSYDFGARMYNPRLGRWMSCDPMAAKYPSSTPFNYVLNSPIVAYDPDGRYTIFINGEVNHFLGFIGSSNSIFRASALYWTNTFINKVENAISDYKGSKHRDFYDGDVGTFESTRYNKGYDAAKKDFKKIMAKLERDANGKIIEPVRLISHSKGSAFSEGYQTAWNEEFAKEDQSQFSGNGGQIEFSLMLAPHQSNYIDIKKSKTATVTITHDWDGFSGDDVLGDAFNIKTDNNMWAFQVQKTHSIDGFHFEAVAAIGQFIDNKKAGRTLNYFDALSTGRMDLYKYKGYYDKVTNARKWYYDRNENKYYGEKDDN